MSESAERTGRFHELSFLAKHSVVYGIGNMLSRIVAFVMLPIYTRHLTPFDYGVMEIVDATTSMIGLVAGLGIAGAMSRFYFSFEDTEARNRVVGTTFLLTGAAIVVIVGSLLPFSSLVMEVLFDRTELASIFVVALAGLGVGLFVDVAQVYLRIQQKSLWYVAVSLANLIVAVALNVYFIVFLKTGVIGIFYASLIARVVVGVPLAVTIVARVGLHLDRKIAAGMYRYSLPLIPSDLANTMIGYSDRYFINHFLSTADAGIYGLAQKLGSVVHLLITSPFLLTYLPRRFEIARNPEAPRTFASVFDYHMLCLVVVSVGLAVFAREVLMVMATPPFYAAADLIPVILLGLVILGMKYHFQFGILYCNKTQYQMYINFTSAGLHVVLNAVLIPTLGLWGALLASLVALTSNTALSLVVARPLYAIPYDFGRLARLLAIAGLLCVVAVAVGTGWTALLVKVVLLALLPIGILAAGVIPADERRRLAQLLQQLQARLAGRDQSRFTDHA